MIDKTQLAFIADIFGVVTGIMTILGLGGVLTWSIFKRGENRLSESVLNIFAYSVKTGICLVLLVFVVPLGFLTAGIVGQFFIYNFLSVFVSTSAFPNPTAYNEYRDSLSQFCWWIGAGISLSIWLPLFVMVSASVYTWSLDPWRRFRVIFRRDKPTSNL